MDISLNVLAVILAAVSTMIVGSIWYGEIGFYKQWAKLAGVKRDPNFTASKAAYLYGGAFLVSLITAIVLEFFTNVIYIATDASFLMAALLAGVMGWLGFTAARIQMHDSFEGRRKQLTFLNLSHELVTILVMSLIIGLLG